MSLSRSFLLSAAVALPLLACGASAANTPGRDLVLRYLHEIDCGYAETAAFPANRSRFEARLLKHVPPMQHHAERSARTQALARRSSGCEHVKHQVRDVSIMCGPGSREHDRWCLHYGGGCAQSDLAAAVRLVHGEQYFNQIDAQRRSLVERIRNREWDRMFAPVATTVTIR